jgi:hypothetical protein
MDIEGSEVHLLNAADNIFNCMKEYLIEIHNEDLLFMLQKKCTANSFEIVSIGPEAHAQTTPPYLAHIKKTQKTHIILM